MAALSLAALLVALSAAASRAEAAALDSRVDAAREPIAAAIARGLGFVESEQAGRTYLRSTEGDWLERSEAEELLESAGLLGQSDPKAAFLAGDAHPSVKDLLSKPPFELREDGTVARNGKVLTVQDYASLHEPLDARRLTPSQEIAAAVARSYAYETRGNRLVQPGNPSPFRAIDAEWELQRTGLSGQKSLDSPFDTRVPSALARASAVAALRAFANKADGTVRRRGRVATVRDIVEMIAPFDLAAKEQEDPETAGKIARRMKEFGFDARVEGSRSFLCAADKGCLSNESIRGDPRSTAAEASQIDLEERLDPKPPRWLVREGFRRIGSIASNVMP